MRVFQKKTKKFKADIEYFFRNGSWVTIRYGVIVVSGLLISVAFSRLVTKELYGQYQFVIAFISFLSLLSLPGLNIVTLRESIKGNDWPLVASVKKSFCWSIFMSLIACGYALHLWYGGKESLAIAVLVAGVLAPFYYAPNNWYVFYEGKKDFFSSSIRIVFTQLILLFLLCGALFYGSGLISLVAIYYTVPAVLAFYYFFEVRKIILSRGQALIQESLDVVLGMIITFQKYIAGLSENIVVFFVSFLFGFELLAVYQVANMVVLAIAGFVSALLSLYFPHIVQGGKVLRLKDIGYSLLAGVPSMVIFLIFLRFFFFPLYGEAYQESLLLGYALTGVVFLIPFKTYLLNFFTAHKKNKIIIGANMLAIVVLSSSLYFTQSLGFHRSLAISLYAFQGTLIGGLLVLSYFDRVGKKDTMIY
jgi:O-antigen/teichoic acid export membrane protein